MGENVVEKEIPADMLEKSKQWREKMIDMIAGSDDKLTDKMLGGEEISAKNLWQLYEEQPWHLN